MEMSAGMKPEKLLASSNSDILSVLAMADEDQLGGSKSKSNKFSLSKLISILKAWRKSRSSSTLPLKYNLLIDEEEEKEETIPNKPLPPMVLVSFTPKLL